MAKKSLVSHEPTGLRRGQMGNCLATAAINGMQFPILIVPLTFTLHSIVPLGRAINTTSSKLTRGTWGPDPKERDENGPPDISVLFRTLSRVNHSCLPNAFFSYNWRTHCGSLRACRRIGVDSEITISYNPMEDWQDTAQRRQYLTEHWKLECRCSVCNEVLKGSNSHKAVREQLRSANAQLEELVTGYKDDGRITPLTASSDETFLALRIIGAVCDLIAKELGSDSGSEEIPPILDPRMMKALVQTVPLIFLTSLSANTIEDISIVLGSGTIPETGHTCPRFSNIIRTPLSLLSAFTDRIIGCFSLITKRRCDTADFQANSVHYRGSSLCPGAIGH